MHVDLSSMKCEISNEQCAFSHINSGGMFTRFVEMLLFQSVFCTNMDSFETLGPCKKKNLW